MKNLFKKFIILTGSVAIFSSCQSGPDACECVQQYNYWSQDGGLLKIDEDLINKCTDKFKDSDATYYPEDLNSAERNARSKCNG